MASDLNYVPPQPRRKSETYWSGLSLSVTTATPLNLVTALKAITPTSGTSLTNNPFFNLTTDKLAVYNENLSATIKISFVGAFTGGATNRGLINTYTLTQSDVLVANRPVTNPNDYFTFIEIIAVDQNGFAATDGVTTTLQAVGGNYVISSVKLVIEQ